MRPTKGEMSVAFASAEAIGLMETEEQRHVAVDALLLEDLGGLDAFPGGGELDENAIAGDAGLVVQGDDGARLGDGLVDVVGEAGVDLGGDAAGDDVENLATEGDFEGPEGLRGDVLVRGTGTGILAHLLQHVIDDGLILGLLCGGGDQRRIRGGVLRLELLDRVEVAGVGDDGGVCHEAVRVTMPWCCSFAVNARCPDTNFIKL